MGEQLDEIIRELSEMYDADNKDSFVSLYVNKGDEEKFIERRMRACKSVFKGDELKHFEDTMDDVFKALKQTAWISIAVFASRKHNFLKTVSLTVGVDDALIVDSSPYLRPLARIQDEWENFTLVLLSSNYAKIFSVSLGKKEHEKTLSKDIMNKHKKGGWSQARFNRLRKGAIHAFLKEVGETLEKISEDQIVLAGPGNAKLQFRDMISKNLKEKIVEIIDISIDDEKELMKESINLIAEREERQSHAAVQQLKSEILKDGLAVYGIKDTSQAVKNGQVELLLIEKDYKPRGWICEHCQVVDEGVQTNCPYCGKKTSEVDVIEEILEFAERTDADIEFTDDEEIANLGHVGGILRFK